jgi:hypothetical protein
MEVNVRLGSKIHTCELKIMCQIHNRLSFLLAVETCESTYANPRNIDVTWPDDHTCKCDGTKCTRAGTVAVRLLETCFLPRDDSKKEQASTKMNMCNGLGCLPVLPLVPETDPSELEVLLALAAVVLQAQCTARLCTAKSVSFMTSK